MGKHSRTFQTPVWETPPFDHQWIGAKTPLFPWADSSTILPLTNICLSNMLYTVYYTYVIPFFWWVFGKLLTYHDFLPSQMKTTCIYYIYYKQKTTPAKKNTHHFPTGPTGRLLAWQFVSCWPAGPPWRLPWTRAGALHDDEGCCVVRSRNVPASSVENDRPWRKTDKLLMGWGRSGNVWCGGWMGSRIWCFLLFFLVELV